MKRLPLVPADSSMQAWPMATPTPTVLICSSYAGSGTPWKLVPRHHNHAEAQSTLYRKPLSSGGCTDLVPDKSHGVVDCCALCLKSHLHASDRNYRHDKTSQAGDRLELTDMQAVLYEVNILGAHCFAISPGGARAVDV